MFALPKIALFAESETHTWAWLIIRISQLSTYISAGSCEQVRLCLRPFIRFLLLLFSLFVRGGGGGGGGGEVSGYKTKWELNSLVIEA